MFKSIPQIFRMWEKVYRFHLGLLIMNLRMQTEASKQKQSLRIKHGKLRGSNRHAKLESHAHLTSSMNQPLLFSRFFMETTGNR